MTSYTHNSSQFYMKLHCSMMACLELVLFDNSASIENDGSEVNHKIWSSQSIPDATGEYSCGVDKIGVVQCNKTENSCLLLHLLGSGC